MFFGWRHCEVHKLHNWTYQLLHVLTYYVFSATFNWPGVTSYISQANQSPHVEFFPTRHKRVRISVLVKVKRWISWTVGDWDSYHLKTAISSEKNEANMHKETKARDGKHSISTEVPGSRGAWDQHHPALLVVGALVTSPPLESTDVVFAAASLS